MTQTTVSTRTRRPGRIAKAAIVFSIVVGTMFGGATAALAETDTLSGQCITVHSYRRGCATDLRVSWGSGMSWSAAGTASNTYRWDDPTPWTPASSQCWMTTCGSTATPVATSPTTHNVAERP